MARKPSTAMRGPLWAAALAAIVSSCTPEQRSAPESWMTVSAAIVNYSGKFGVYNSDQFQNNWNPNFAGWNNDMTMDFRNTMDDIASLEFEWGLAGSESYIEDLYNDHLTSERVDVMWLATHGGVDGTEAFWAMWESGVLANSLLMRLGDEERNQRLLISVACNTLYSSDGLFVQRWQNVFRGGLKFVAGYWLDVFFAPTTVEVGEDFVTNLKNDWTIDNAWGDAADDWLWDNEPSYWGTGTSLSNCEQRTDLMRYDHMLSDSSTPQLRDGQIAYYCGWNWD